MVIFAAKFAGRTLASGLIAFTVAGLMPVVGVVWREGQQ